jgi:hypothetical protein
MVDPQAFKHGQINPDLLYIHNELPEGRPTSRITRSNPVLHSQFGINDLGAVQGVPQVFQSRVYSRVCVRVRSLGSGGVVLLLLLPQCRRIGNRQEFIVPLLLRDRRRQWWRPKLVFEVCHCVHLIEGDPVVGVACALGCAPTTREAPKEVEHLSFVYFLCGQRRRAGLPPRGPAFLTFCCRLVKNSCVWRAPLLLPQACTGATSAV